MKNLSSQPFFIDKWLVEPTLNKISCQDQEIQLAPKVMSALVLLASANGQLISHEDLISSLWPNQVVSDSSLYQTISSLRKQLGDTQTQRQYPN